MKTLDTTSFFKNAAFPAALPQQVAVTTETTLPEYLAAVKARYNARLVWYSSERKEVAIFTRPANELVGNWGGADMIFSAQFDFPLPAQGKTFFARNRAEAERGGIRPVPQEARVWGKTASGEILEPDETPSSGHPNHKGVPMWLAILFHDGYAVGSVQ